MSKQQDIKEEIIEQRFNEWFDLFYNELVKDYINDNYKDFKNWAYQQYEAHYS